MDAKVYAVDKVAFYLSKSKPPQMVVLAEGRVPTSGWSHGRLSPYGLRGPAGRRNLGLRFHRYGPHRAIVAGDLADCG